jgi:glutathione S-transferase
MTPSLDLWNTHMKLYYAPGACSLSVHIALREVGAEFDPVRVDLRTHQLADGSDYTTIAPRGYVPVLSLPDGSRHSEAASLLQYVADLDPSQALIGAHGTPRRLAVIEWLTFVSTELHKTFGPLWNPQAAESTRAAATSTLAKRFAELERHFAEHQHLAGGFSVADAYAFTVLSWAALLGQSLAPYPKLQQYLGRIAARPQVQAALRAEGLTK